MVAFLGIIFLLAFGNALFSVFELLQTWRPGATVFQQISVRLDLGLSLLTMATAGGLAAILEQSRSQTAALVAGLAKLQPALAVTPPPLQATKAERAAAPATRAGEGDASVYMHRGVTFYSIDGEYVATVKGQEIKAATPENMRERITTALNG